MTARLLIMLLAFFACCLKAFASDSVPKAALPYLPRLIDAQHEIWPNAPLPSFLAAQIEQETCITLTHKKCWNPRAELKTARENGVGLGQFTRAYNPNGSIRFDAISELVAEHDSLKGWSWERRYDAGYQLKAIVEMDKALFERQRGAASDIDRLSFTLSAYNGGFGGVLQDRRLCANTPGCDQSRWKGHVEKNSVKSKRPHPGYGKSFYAINREYVSNILDIRRPKYDTYFK